MTHPPRSLFVTGTDTGVGKTVVSCALIRALRARGLQLGALKPAETGVGDAGPLDAIALRRATGDDALPLDAVCPQQFALPAAPNVAAAAEGRGVDVDRIRAAHAASLARHDVVVVEGAGGLLVPLDDRLTMADLAAELGLPVLVVARASLGTINHTTLTLAELERRGLELLGVVVSHADGKLSDADAANLGALRGILGERLVGEVPPLEAGAEPDEGVFSPGWLAALPGALGVGNGRV